MLPVTNYVAQQHNFSQRNSLFTTLLIASMDKKNIFLFKKIQ